MTPCRLALLFAALLLAAGCSTSREATQPASPTPPEETPAAEQEPGEPPAEPEAPAADTSAAASPDQAPTDWQHSDVSTESRYPGVATNRAYDWLEGRSPRDTIVVAVLDSGIDPTHEDLDDVLWTNADEVPGNEQDDDQNGYVDDVRGWNFLGGPDGENVQHDTFEVTRLYAAMRDTYGDVDPDTLTAAEEAKYERFRQIRADFREQRQRYEQQYSQIQRIAGIVAQARPAIESVLGTDAPITLERLQNLPATAGQDARQAAGLFTTLLQQSGESNVGAVVKSLSNAEEQLQTRVEYNFDPDYDPRPIVGDDYADVAERFYGNTDVAGPEPGHGTGVASLIGAERDNGLGLRGVANAVKIMPVRTVPGGDERDKDVANAIRYATENGADIINMSFGKAYSPRKDAVDAAVQFAEEEGVLMVHAAGNDGEDVDTTDSYPSAYYAEGAGVAESWIEVGASTAEGDSLLAASFSNYGQERVDLFAPGASIYVARPGDAYGRVQGTSFAAPVVSGVAALVMAYYPELSAEAVKQALLSSVTDYADLQVRRPGSQGGLGTAEMVSFGTLSRTGGVVNAYQALRTADRMANE